MNREKLILHLARIAARVCTRCGINRVFKNTKVCTDCETLVEKKKKRQTEFIYGKAKLEYLKLRDEVYEHYGGYKCACCGCHHREMLQIDHKIGGGSAHIKLIRLLGYKSIYHWLKHHGFPSGFEPLCANCNHGRHRRGGMCPHKPDGEGPEHTEDFNKLRDIILGEAGGHEFEMKMSERISIAMENISDEDERIFKEFFLKHVRSKGTILQIFETGMREKIELWPWNQQVIKAHLDRQIKKNNMQIWDHNRFNTEDTYCFREGWDRIENNLHPVAIKWLQELNRSDEEKLVDEQLAREEAENEWPPPDWPEDPNWVDEPQNDRRDECDF